jgi:hypothetical protein
MVDAIGLGSAVYVNLEGNCTEIKENININWQVKVSNLRLI